MVSGGTRFTRSERIIDVEVRPRRDTLYDVLVVTPSESSRRIRKVARELRRNLPDAGALHDICLAEEVLGRPELRREYDALLARVRAANRSLPQIGTAIEGARLEPKGTSGAGKLARLLGRFGLMFVLMVAAAVVLGTIGSRRSSDDRYKVPELPPIPKFELDRKLFDYKPLDLEKIDPSLLAPPDIDPSLLLPSQPVPKPLHAPVRTTKATKPK